MPALAAMPESVPSHISTVVHADARTGKLVRSFAVEPRAASAGRGQTSPAIAADDTNESLGGLIDRIAEQQGVEAPLVHSVIKAESNYNPAAVSPKGALGMMQLIPATAKRFGVTNSFNVADNIQGGVRYLRFLLDYYNNDYVRAIAAYNAGEAAVDKYNGIPPYSETRNYVYTVARNLKSARAQQESRLDKNLGAAARTAPATPAPGTIVAVTGPDGKLYYKTP